MSFYSFSISFLTTITVVVLLVLVLAVVLVVCFSIFFDELSFLLALYVSVRTDVDSRRSRMPNAHNDAAFRSESVRVSGCVCEKFHPRSGWRAFDRALYTIQRKASKSTVSVEISPAEPILDTNRVRRQRELLEKKKRK